MSFNYKYPTVEDLRRRAQKRIPRFAFEYMDGGCNEDVNLERNTKDLQDVILKPIYLRDCLRHTIKTNFLGYSYDAPFGIAPIGLQGLIWPGAPEILASSAYRHNIPFILSTVSTSSIEKISKITEGRAWFQLYHPAEEALKKDILRRCYESGYEVLVILCDVPSFGFRPRDIRNGLAMPPRMSINNLMQVISRPEWALKTLYHGQPSFQTMIKYMPENLNLKQLGSYMNSTFSGKLDKDRISRIRDQWKGKLVLKGVSSIEDAHGAIDLGLDGIIVSNHGGRQLDAAESAIDSLRKIKVECNGKIEIAMDSGIRSGVDIARVLASGSEFAFLGRAFMYSVAALGNEGGDHLINLLKAQFLQVMQQLNCEETCMLSKHVV